MADRTPRQIVQELDRYIVGQDAAKEDIAQCREMAEAAGAKPGEGKAGQVAGSTAVGAGVGAAGGAVGGAIYGAAGPAEDHVGLVGEALAEQASRSDADGTPWIAERRYRQHECRVGKRRAPAGDADRLDAGS